MTRARNVGIGRQFGTRVNVRKERENEAPPPPPPPRAMEDAEFMERRRTPSERVLSLSCLQETKEWKDFAEHRSYCFSPTNGGKNPLNISPTSERSAGKDERASARTEEVARPCMSVRTRRKDATAEMKHERRGGGGEGGSSPIRRVSALNGQTPLPPPFKRDWDLEGERFCKTCAGLQDFILF